MSNWTIIGYAECEGTYYLPRKEMIVQAPNKREAERIAMREFPRIPRDWRVRVGIIIENGGVSNELGMVLCRRNNRLSIGHLGYYYLFSERTMIKQRLVP